MFPNDWITTAEAAQISRYHVEHICRLIRNDQIHARKWGKEWMVDKNSLLEYLNRDIKPGPNGDGNFVVSFGTVNIRKTILPCR